MTPPPLQFLRGYEILIFQEFYPQKKFSDLAGHPFTYAPLPPLEIPDLPLALMIMLAN